jgi:hypothetical protein
MPPLIILTEIFIQSLKSLQGFFKELSYPLSIKYAGIFISTGEVNKMKIKWILAGVSVLALAALAVGGLLWARTAYAQSQTPNGPGYPYGMMGGFGMMGGYGYGPMQTYMVQGLAEALNLQPADLQKRLSAGETPWQIAQSQGLSDAQIQQAMLEAHDKALDAAVQAGFLTQEQADWMDQHMEFMWGAAQLGSGINEAQPGSDGDEAPGNPSSGIPSNAAPGRGFGSMMGGSRMGW